MGSTDRCTALNASSPMHVVVMGVSGAGKSSVGAVLARRLALRFVDGDALHSEASLAKLRRGVALDDADRLPWLDRVGACLADTAASPAGTVVACSALRRAYRGRLRRRVPGLRFLFLDVPAAVLQARLASRVDHVMPASLLASQLATLERPGHDETDVLCIAAADGLDDVVAAAVAVWRGSESACRTWPRGEPRQSVVDVTSMPSDALRPP